MLRGLCQNRFGLAPKQPTTWTPVGFPKGRFQKWRFLEVKVDGSGGAEGPNKEEDFGIRIPCLHFQRQSLHVSYADKRAPGSHCVLNTHYENCFGTVSLFLVLEGEGSERSTGFHRLPEGSGARLSEVPPDTRGYLFMFCRSDRGTPAEGVLSCWTHSCLTGALGLFGEEVGFDGKGWQGCLVRWVLVS